MIKIEEYTFEEDFQEDFIDFMKELYDQNSYSLQYINYIKKIINKSNPTFKFVTVRNFIAYEDKNVVGHISAIIDSRLNKNERVGLIGFYECIDNLKISNLLINKATDFLKVEECKKIHAPVDLTIWHPYRFVLEPKEDSFLLEPITKDYYIEQFKSEGFDIAVEYGSAERSDFDTIMDYTKNDHENVLSEGFKIRTLKKEDYVGGILSIYNLSNNIFKNSWSFVEISKEEYMYIYEDYERNIDNVLIQIISDKYGKDVGFCSSIIDQKRNIIILKTIGILPEYQNKRVGAALLYEQHKIASERKFSKEIYALIKLGNIVTKLPYPGFKVIRKYIVLEKKII